MSSKCRRGIENTNIPMFIETISARQGLHIWKIVLALITFTHYNDVIISAMASQIISFTIVYWSVYSGADQRKHQSSASLAFVRGIHRWPVNSIHIGPVTRQMFTFVGVIMLKDLPKCLLVLLAPCDHPNSLLKPLYMNGRTMSNTDSKGLAGVLRKPC